MSKDTNSDHLGVIANLLALQLTKDMSHVDSVMMLKKSGMRNHEVGQVLGISGNSVSAHVSNKKKQLEQATKRNAGKKAKSE